MLRRTQSHHSLADMGRTLDDWAALPANHVYSWRYYCRGWFGEIGSPWPCWTKNIRYRIVLTLCGPKNTYGNGFR